MPIPVSLYEFYHPLICARQLGFGQLPISLFFVDKLKTREPIASRLEFMKISSFIESLPMGDLDGFIHSPFYTWLFTI